MIELRAISKRYGEKKILSDFSYRFAAGKTTCLLGPSGCGKTTLLRIASGLEKSDTGTVRSANEPYTFVFQEDRLLPWFSVLENLTNLGIPEKQAMYWLVAMGLQHECNASVNALSGGMQRRLCVARAMAAGGNTFFLDEPLRGLDAITVEQVLAAVRPALAGKTVLLISHHLAEAFALADTFVAVDGLPMRVVREVEKQSIQTVEALAKWLYASSKQ